MGRYLIHEYIGGRYAYVEEIHGSTGRESRSAPEVKARTENKKALEGRPRTESKRTPEAKARTKTKKDYADKSRAGGNEENQERVAI